MALMIVTITWRLSHLMWKQI